MRRIYSGAAEVNVYLGTQRDGSENIPYLLVKVIEAGVRCSKAGLIDGNLNSHAGPGVLEEFRLPDPKDKAWHELEFFFMRDWFRRIWVIQEVTLAKKAMVTCGNWSLPWDSVMDGLFKAYLLCAGRFLKGTDTHDGYQIGTATTAFAQLNFLHDLKNENKAFKPWKLIDLLQVGRLSSASHAHDYCYALMGLSQELGTQDLTIDYSLSTEAVYRQFSRFFVQQGHGVNVLYNAHTRKLSLPSWIPDWSVRDIAPIGISSTPSGKIEANPAAAAATCHTSDIRLHNENPDVLIVRAVLFDSIKTIGRMHKRATMKQEVKINGKVEDYTHPNIALVGDCISELHELLFKDGSHAVYATGEDQADITWRTLSCDCAKNSQQRAPPEYINYYRSLLLSIKASYPTCSLPHEPYFTSLTWNEAVQNMMREAKDALFMLELMKIHCLLRRRGRTSNGYVGQFPVDARKGDVVCVPLGSAVPFVVRRVRGESFTLVGECYVHGIMQGEIFERDSIDAKYIEIE